MNDTATVNGSAYYEVEIKRNPIGLMWGEVYRVGDGTRELVGRTDSPAAGGGLAMSRAAVLPTAKRLARQHRDGNEVIRLDLD